MHAEKTMRVDELQHTGLLAFQICIRKRRIADGRFRQGRESALDGAVRHIVRAVRQSRQRVEIGAPFIRHSIWIKQILLVQLLDEGRIRAEQQ